MDNRLNRSDPIDIPLKSAKRNKEKSEYPVGSPGHHLREKTIPASQLMSSVALEFVNNNNLCIRQEDFMEARENLKKLLEKFFDQFKEPYSDDEPVSLDKIKGDLNADQPWHYPEGGFHLFATLGGELFPGEGNPKEVSEDEMRLIK
ncbi:hypothetical protein [Aquicella lusitana]|uniref:Uncharacterized protein n=1 Tax=Aquicella lusitana TaxID=254246 RepID=A0A370G8T6_9COXI|nr:hypothetical protein [Aquicella lusitana]RDI40181.1 hypothetical protein C8D86_12315 [Aquicella lusitana]VVC72428.1 hypothetical protein AQULUS_01400 [Aquicella lusitana]